MAGNPRPFPGIGSKTHGLFTLQNKNTLEVVKKTPHRVHAECPVGAW
jgi:hypothetical protein